MFSKFKFEVITSSSYFNPSKIYLYENEILFTPFSGASYSAKSIYQSNPIYNPQYAFESGGVYHSNSESDPHWISINLGTTKKQLTSIKIENRTDTHLPLSMIIYGSNDEVTWILINTITFEAWTATSNTLIRFVKEYFEDPYFSNVSLLLPFSTNFNNNSPSPATITISGNTSISATQSKWGIGSAYFDGSGDYLTIASNENFNFGTGDFTIECWTNFEDGVNDWTIAGGVGPTNGDWMFARKLSNELSFGRSAVAWDKSVTLSWTSGVWYHLAVARSGSTLKMFRDGIEVASTTNTMSYNIVNSTFGIGTRQMYPGVLSYGAFFKGYIQDLRITKGVARYTSNFTSPKQFNINFDPYFSNVSLLLPLSTNFNDNSPNPKTISVVGNTLISATQSKWGTGSAYFDGTGDYLNVPDSASFGFGTSDFTLECWIFLTSSNSRDFQLFDFRSGSGQNGLFYIDGTATKCLAYYNGTVYTGGSVISLNQWSHIAFVRSNDVTNAYLNGISQWSSSAIFDFGTSRPLTFANNFIYSTGFIGYIQDIRITKGIARYTDNFTPPTQPFYFEIQKIYNQIQDKFFQYHPLAILALSFTANYRLNDFFEFKFGPSYVGIDSFNYEFVTGNNYIEGNITLDHSPISRKVRLHILADGRLIRECWSDPITGFYRFDNLKVQEYYIWSENSSDAQEKSFKVTNYSTENNFDFLSGNQIDVSASSSRFYLTGNAKLKNGIRVTQVTLLTYPTGSFIANITPELNGDYSIYLNKGSEYIFLFIGPQPYKPESYYYKVPE